MAKVKVQKVAILGLGYVGLPLARVLSKHRSYRVVGIDINAARIRELRNEQRRSLIEFTTDFSRLAECDIAVVCVPTPVDRNFTPNYEPLKSAVQQIANYLHKGQLVVIESTINPGTCEEVVLPILERASINSRNAKGERDFFLAHCPERIDPGSKKWHLVNIPRIVGGLGKKSRKLATDFYKSFIGANIKPLNSLKAAEATKIVENAFRDINIAFVNELAQSFDKFGIDISEVIAGASTKPFAFMPHQPGCGVGGHCIPVDPYYLIERARKQGFSHDFLKMARAVNHSMPAYTVKLLEKEMARLRLSKNKTTVGLLGLSYKPNIADLRESPALEILDILKKKNFRVVTHDPHVGKLSSARSLAAFLKKSDVVVLATAHREFRKLTPEVLKSNNIVAVIDGRNVLPKERILRAGIAYKGIGR
ncbi:MAG: nucleotide sugar dehydrogenase [Patescibacteria group bacterium]